VVESDAGDVLNVYMTRDRAEQAVKVLTKQINKEWDEKSDIDVGINITEILEGQAFGDGELCVLFNGTNRTVKTTQELEKDG